MSDELFFLEENEEYTLAPLAPKVLAAFERKHGIRFPDSLRRELLRLNGGAFAQNGFRVRGRFFIIGGFRGVNLKEQGAHRLQPLSDYGPYDRAQAWPVAIPLDSDPAKIFFFDYESIPSQYAALDFSASSRGPSVWIFGDEGEAVMVGASWDEFLSTAYGGDETSFIDLDAGWEGYQMLLDEKCASCRTVLGLKNGRFRLKRESVFSGGMIYRQECCFRHKNVQGAYMCQQPNGQPGLIDLNLTVSELEEPHYSKFEDGRWLDSTGNADTNGLQVSSSRKAFAVLKLVIA